jgi:hypothetical protein
MRIEDSEECPCVVRPCRRTDGTVAFRALAAFTEFSSFGVKCTSGFRSPFCREFQFALKLRMSRSAAARVRRQGEPRFRSVLTVGIRRCHNFVFFVRRGRGVGAPTSLVDSKLKGKEHSAARGAAPKPRHHRHEGRRTPATERGPW